MDDLHIVEGSRLHRDILVLKHHWNLLSEWETVQRAVTFQAELASRLEQQLEVRLWGGPPYDSLRYAPSAMCRLRWASESMPMRLMQITEPNGEQAVYLVQDAAEPDDRIYEIHDGRGNATPILGSEMDSLCAWWADERLRKPSELASA